MDWRDYHESTKHTPESLRRAPHFLDWANMPDPFRHYEGVPLLDLPAGPPQPGIATRTGAQFLSQLLFHSAAISAAKVVPSTGSTYALRVNPSSGNLHPTEFHFVTNGLADWPDGLYHYRPSSHMAEQRALGQFLASPAPIVFVLTSIAWREAWKYRSRAYRYCLHDIGHAWQALSLAAKAAGCETRAIGHFADDDLALALKLNQDEWPMLMVEIGGSRIPARQRKLDGMGTADTRWFGGEANRLSIETITYPLIDGIHVATKLAENSHPIATAEPPPPGSGGTKLPPPALSCRPFGELARTRRSALDFVGGSRSASFAQLSAILHATAQPYFADFSSSRFVQLYLYAHRIDGLDRGVYRYWPDQGELETVKQGDQRVVAAGLSLGQDLAGNACVAFSLVADLDRATRAHGDRGYRYVHFEAGAIGQRLYMAAEAQGLRGTGIGAFYDDHVHRYLDLGGVARQVVYHFAIGFPVFDSRLEA